MDVRKKTRAIKTRVFYDAFSLLWERTVLPVLLLTSPAARNGLRDLLTQVLAASPAFFEQLMVDLMIAMGYGGSRKEAGQATQQTNDDGIDGICHPRLISKESTIRAATIMHCR